MAASRGSSALIRAQGLRPRAGGLAIRRLLRVADVDVAVADVDVAVVDLDVSPSTNGDSASLQRDVRRGLEQLDRGESAPLDMEAIKAKARLQLR